ncbi:MAG: TIGR00374 family protein [Patescibacteria group bacterium]|nr:MAG: TIGR00374 family protein [Patescibacteria group bacterium]
MSKINIIKNFDPVKQERKILLFTVLAIIVYSFGALFLDIKQLLQLSSQFNWLLLPLLILLSFINYIFRSLRFFYYLKTINTKVSYKQSFIIFMSTLSMTLTPGKSGEILKAYLLKKQTNEKLFKFIPVLILERFMDGIAMLILGSIGVYYFLGSIPFLFIFSIAPLFLLYIIFHYRKNIVNIVKRFEHKLPKLRLLESLIIFFSNSEKLIKFKVIANSLVLSLLAWTFESYALYLILNYFGFSGLKILAFSFFVFSFSSIAGFFVLIPGGIGIAEGSLVSFITLFLKADTTTAGFITLLFRLITLWFGVIIGILFFYKFIFKRVSKPSNKPLY